MTTVKNVRIETELDDSEDTEDDTGMEKIRTTQTGKYEDERKSEGQPYVI